MYNVANAVILLFLDFQRHTYFRIFIFVHFWTYFFEIARDAKICKTARQKMDFYSYLEYSAYGYIFYFSK